MVNYPIVDTYRSAYTPTGQPNLERLGGLVPTGMYRESELNLTARMTEGQGGKVMEQGNLKAIPTRYAGCFFRSRLEARWATFFDALGVAWEYEPEGFILEGAGAYLPDFWLPQVRMWAEVKPVDFSDQERTKSRALAQQSGFPCLLLVGTPDTKPYEADDPQGETWTYALTNYHGYVQDEGRFFSSPDDDNPFPDTVAAVETARSARFEFGEHGGSPKMLTRPSSPAVIPVNASVQKESLRTLYAISGRNIDRFMAVLAKITVFRHLTRESPELQGIFGDEVPQ